MILPGWLIAFLIRYLLPTLVEFFLAFLGNLKKARADDPGALEVIEGIVRGVALAHPDWDGAKKRAWAFEAAQDYFAHVGKDVGDSLINTLIELSVQKAKADHVPPDSAVTLGSTQ